MTAVTTIRDHLLGLSTAFAEGNREAVPSRNICDYDHQHSEAFTRLTRAWDNCVGAASVIRQRLADDWSAGGPLCIIAAPVRACAMAELVGLWAAVVETYLAEVADG